MKASEALRLLKATRVTLCSYVRTGKIKATKLANGQYEYNDESIYIFYCDGKYHSIKHNMKFLNK